MGFWENYYENGIIPNLWKGFTGQTSADRNTDASNEAQLEEVEKTNAANLEIANNTNQANIDIANSTNQTNKEIAQENLAHQRELLEYQKEIQKKQWEREDTSYQRTKSDMLQAGLNPLSMQGTNGAGEVVSMSPLHNDYQAQQSAPMQAAQMQAAKLNAYQSRIASTNEILNAMGSVADSINSIFTGIKQRDSLQTEVDKQKLFNYITARDEGIHLFDDKNFRYFDSYDMFGIGTGSPSSAFGSNARKKHFDSEYSFYNSLAKDYESSNLRREYEHKVASNIFDSDLKEERVLTALEDWVSNGRMKEFLDNMKKGGLDLLSYLWSPKK